MRKLAALLLTLVLSLPLGMCAAEPSEEKPNISDVRMPVGDNCVAYPQLDGIADEEVRKRINDDIVASADITGYIVTLTTLVNGNDRLNVDYETFLGGDVFSVLISAKGKQPTGRSGHEYTALSYDLRSGDRLKASDLFKDTAKAEAYMERILNESLFEELNSYSENNALTPLPIEAFAVDAEGITFVYPGKQLAYLSGYAGACRFDYCELEELLIDAPDGIPARLNALREPLEPKKARDQIERYINEGRLPTIPAAIGEPMTELIDRFRLMRTPDDFPGGRYYRLEDARFRDVYIISDSLRGSGEWEHSFVEGIRIERGELCGLVIGKAARTEWIEILGEPDESIEFTDSMAYDYDLPVGSSDVYTIGKNTLRLHADENGILQCVRLQKY